MTKKAAMPRLAVAALMASVPAAVIGSPRAEAPAGNLEKLLGEVKQEIARIGGDAAKTAEEAQKEIKQLGALSEETKQRVDKVLTDQGNLQQAQAKLEGRLEAAEAQNLALEQALASRGGARQGERRQSLGEAIVSAESLKTFVANGARGSLSIEVKNAITSAGGSAGTLIAPDRREEVVGLPRQQLRIRDLLSQGSTTSNLVEYMKQLSRVINAAPVAEGGMKPESDLTYEKAEAAVRTIAHWVHVSRQAMDDAAQLQSEIDTELRYGLDFVEDAQLLAGDGTGENLSGLITNATAYSGAAEAKIASPTRIDKLRVALLEASLALYPADGMVLHPEDWMVIETTKDAENRYIFANPTGVAGPVLWGRSVVPTLAMTVDEFLVGAFKMAATIYDRMETEVLISSEDRDNFVKNMLTVRAEKRLALAVKRPKALIHGNFTPAP